MSDELKREIWANAVLKDGKCIFVRSGRKCIDLYDFFDDFRSVGLNYEKEIKTGRYNLVTKQVEKAEDCTKFYRQYKPYTCDCSGIDWDKKAEEWKKRV